MTLSRKRESIVKVTLPDTAPLTPIINQRNRAPCRHHIGPDTKQALGSDRYGYFLAEFAGGQWWIGRRIPHDLGW